MRVNIIVSCNAPVEGYELGLRDGEPVAIVNGMLPDDELGRTVVAARAELIRRQLADRVN